MDSGSFISSDLDFTGTYHVRRFCIAIIWFSFFDWQDHNRHGGLVAGPEDFVYKPVPVNFRATPVLVAFLLRNLFRGIPDYNENFTYEVAEVFHLPLAMDGPVYERWPSEFLLIPVSEVGQVIICIMVKRDASGLKTN